MYVSLSREACSMSKSVLALDAIIKYQNAYPHQYTKNMSNGTSRTGALIASNIRYLMRRRDMSSERALAGKSGVAQKQINKNTQINSRHRECTRWNCLPQRWARPPHNWFQSISRYMGAVTRKQRHTIKRSMKRRCSAYWMLLTIILTATCLRTRSWRNS